MFHATETILSREGYAAWSEEYVCELCECSRGALRYQFPNGKYDLLPAFLETVIAQDARMVESLGELKPVERMYLFLLSMRFRPPSPATRALLEISMAARGDAKLFELIEPVIESANARVLGISTGVTDPEMIALRCILHGASMYSFQKDFSPERLSQSLGWILEQLPIPPAVAARTAEMVRVRREVSEAEVKNR
ncbi:MAG: TetR/AcrR family transcriptional regulator [Burkholderiaceae bacterium]|nr:TetR/AcrR family transcriptional regulator [Burkholderiaceae bacterium]